MKKVAVVNAKRSPVGKIPGELNYIGETELLSLIFKEVSLGYENFIDEAVVGSAFPVERDNLCRKAVLQAGLPEIISASTVSKTCASSDEALLFAYNKIMNGKAKAFLVGGIEKISNSSYTLHFMKKNIKKSVKDDLPYFRDVENRIAENDMVYINEMLCRKYTITRKMQDAFTAESIRKAAKANQLGYFKNEIVPIRYDKDDQKHFLDTDELLLTERTVNAINNAKPMFVKDGTLTQYNAAQMCDCAASVLLMDYTEAKRLGIEPLAFILDTACIGLSKDRIGLAMVNCVEKILKDNHLCKSDIDLYETNESFAATAIITENILNLDYNKVNVNGGNLALGYPIGATGLRMSITLLYEMIRRNFALGLSVMCAGGNMANAVILERARI